jgi:TetR/AcrR family transcriptional repressor of nem operon
MGRPKEFDKETVLDTAIEVFRRQGYEGTSVQDLVDQMGIHRASMYDTFGDKHALYLAALDRYHQRQFARRTSLLENHATIREAFARIYQDIIDEMMSTGGISFGCLMINASVERASVDTECAGRVEKNWAAFTELYEVALRKARERGEINAAKTDADLRAMAHFILAITRALRVTAKTNCSRETLEDIARIALTTLAT